jgi:hypothetical protein
MYVSDSSDAQSVKHYIGQLGDQLRQYIDESFEKFTHTYEKSVVPSFPSQGRD